MDFETTEEIEVPEKLIDQVIGQDGAVEIIKRQPNRRGTFYSLATPGQVRACSVRA